MKKRVILLFLFVWFTIHCNTEIPNDSIIEFKQYNVIVNTYEEYFEGEKIYNDWNLIKGFIIFCKNVTIMYEEYLVDNGRNGYVLRYYYNDGRCVTNERIIFNNCNIKIVDTNICIISLNNEDNDVVIKKFRIEK